jgi:hypothetical protein
VAGCCECGDEVLGSGATELGFSVMRYVREKKATYFSIRIL